MSKIHQQILELLAEGYTASEVALALGIPESWVYAAETLYTE